MWERPQRARQSPDGQMTGRPAEIKCRPRQISQPLVRDSATEHAGGEPRGRGQAGISRKEGISSMSAIACLAYVCLKERHSTLEDKETRRRYAQGLGTRLMKPREKSCLHAFPKDVSNERERLTERWPAKWP